MSRKVGVVSAVAIRIIFGKLLSDADSLKVHSKHSWDARRRGTVMIEAADLVEDRLHLFLVVLHGANRADGVVESRSVGDFRSVEIIDP